MNKKPTAIGCHVYAGGFALGVKRHFDVIQHLEEWNFGVETVRQNLKIPVSVSAPEYWNPQPADFVFCNPPCAVWSQLGARPAGAWVNDPRVIHWRHCMDLLERIKPKVWACESVRGAYIRGRSLTEDFVRQGQKLGYQATHLLVDAKEHGVPQEGRRRYLLVLSRVALDWQPTGLKEDVTIRAAWRRLPPRRTEVTRESSYITKALLRKARPGEDLRATFNRVTPLEDQIVDHGKVRGRPAFSLKRLRDLDGLSHVITGGRSFIHPMEHRFLTVEEQQLLCGYPPDYVFAGAVSQQYAQIGKAVMPPVGEYVARIVAHGLKRNKKPLSLAPEEVTIWRDKVERRDVLPLALEAAATRYIEATKEHHMPNPTIDCPTCRGTGKILAPASLAKKEEPEAPRKTAPSAPQSKSVQKRLGTYEPPPVKRVKIPQPSAGNGKGSGYRMREMLAAGKLSPEQILAQIHKEFPGSKAKMSDLAWNKRKLALQDGRP